VAGHEEAVADLRGQVRRLQCDREAEAARLESERRRLEAEAARLEAELVRVRCDNERLRQEVGSGHTEKDVLTEANEKLVLENEGDKKWPLRLKPGSPDWANFRPVSDYLFICGTLMEITLIAQNVGLLFFKAKVTY
jgi:hypothetical protein